MKETFAISETYIGVLSAAMFYVYAPMQLIVGYFIDKFGAKPILVFGFFAMCIGSIFFGLSNCYLTAIIARGLIGLGGSFAFVCVTYVPPHFFPKKRVNFLVCLAIGLALLGPVFAQTLFPIIVHAIGWKLSMISVGIVMGLLAIWTIIALWSITEDNGGHNPYRYFLPICRKSQTWVIAFTAGLFYLISSTFGYLWGVPFFIHGKGFNPHIAALITTTIFIGGILFAPQIGHLSDTRFTPKSVILFLSLAGAILFSLLLAIPTSIPLAFILIFLIGVCAAGENLCYVLAFQEHSDKAKGMAVGITNFIIILITAIFQPLVGILIEYTNQIQKVMWIFPATLVATFILGLFLRGIKNDPQRKMG